MRTATPLESVLKRDRAVVLAGVFLIAALAWAYTVYLAYDTGNLKLGSGMTMGMAMPDMQSWGAVDWGSMFLMWAVMMMAMMVPTAAPMILLFATVNRRRREQHFAIGQLILQFVDGGRLRSAAPKPFGHEAGSAIYDASILVRLDWGRITTAARATDRMMGWMHNASIFRTSRVPLPNGASCTNRSPRSQTRSARCFRSCFTKG